MVIDRVLVVGLVLALFVPVSAARTARCKPNVKAHSVEAHSATRGHHVTCGTEESGSIEVTKGGGVGQIDVQRGYAAVVQRDEGIVALVKLSGNLKVVGRYEDTVDQALDGDVSFSDDGEWLFFARQTSNFDEDGVHVLDVSDKTAPALTQYQPGGGSFRLEYYKDEAGTEWVIVLDAIEGLVVNRFVRETGTLVKVFNDSQPALKVGGPASAGLAISKKDPATGSPLLYVTTGATGLQVYDLSDPTMPEIVGTWSDVGLADVEVKATKTKRTVYAATEYWFDKTIPPEVVVLDATKLDAIEKSGTRSLDVPADDLWRVQGIEFSRGHLYTAHSHIGLIEMKGSRITGVASVPEKHNEGAGYAATPYAMDVISIGRYLLLSDASTGYLTRVVPDAPTVIP